MEEPSISTVASNNNFGKGTAELSFARNNNFPNSHNTSTTLEQSKILKQAPSSSLHNASVQLPQITRALNRGSGAQSSESPDFQFQTINQAGAGNNYNSINRYKQMTGTRTKVNSSQMDESNINILQGLPQSLDSSQSNALLHQNSFTMGLNNSKVYGTHSRQGANSYLNPFAIKRTTEQLLIQREQERMQKIKRENSLSQQMSQLTTLNSVQDSNSKYKKNSLANYMDAPVIQAHLKRNYSKDPNHQNSVLASLIPKIGSTASNSGNLESLQLRTKGLSVNDGYLKNLSFQPREGSIRLVNQIGATQGSPDGKLNSSVYSPNRGSHTLTDMKTNYKKKKRYGTVNHSIDVRKGALVQEDSLHKDISRQYIQSIDPFGERGSLERLERDRQIIIRDLPPTVRYLTKNAFASTHASPRENSKDLISNIRSIFYAQMNIENKKEETQKLKEYILMEREKLEEARRVFEEDQDKFQKYMTEMEQQADKARESTEKAIRDKGDLTEDIERLQIEIGRVERETAQVEDELRQAQVYKEFISLVKAQRKFKSKGGQEDGRSTTRLGNNQSKLGGESVAGSVLGGAGKTAYENFFITEDAQRIFQDSPQQQDASLMFNTSAQSFLPNEFEIDLSKNEFLDIIQSLEDANIFLLDNIENEEQDLEKFERASEEKYKEKRWILDEIQTNINMYSNKIAERKLKKKSIKTFIAGFGKTQAAQDDLLKKGQSASQGQSGSGMNTGQGKNAGLGLVIGSEANNIKHLDFKGQMAVLKAIIAKLYAKVKGSSHEQPSDESVLQLGEIEQIMAKSIERRELILYNGEGTEAQARAIQEAEKIVDKDRKQIRYEKKKKLEQDEIKEKKLKVEKRMERSNNQSKNAEGTKLQMPRSQKPEIIKIVDDPNKNITQEEMDYMRYVDSIQINPTPKQPPQKK